MKEKDSAARKQRWASDPGYRAAKKANHRRWYENNQETVLSRRLQYTYGINLSQYNEKLAAQGGVCAVCAATPDGQRLNVDHDHRTGAIRDLLCRRCNSVLGLVDDGAGLLSKLIGYIRKHTKETPNG